MNCIEPLIERAEVYGKESLELLKLKAIDRVTDISSTITSRVYFFIAIFMFASFISIGASLWLGDLLGRIYYGFFCIASIYAILELFIYFVWHQQIKRYYRNSFISALIKEKGYE